MSRERKEVMKTFLRRVKNILLHPRDEWKVIKDEPVTYKQLIGGYISALAAIPLTVSIVEAALLGPGTSDFRFASIVALLMQSSFWYVMIVVDIMILGAIVNAFVTPSGVSSNGSRGLQIAAYSATPLFLVGIVVSIPLMRWLQYVAVLYSVYLLYLGIRSLMGMQQGRAAGYAVASFLAGSIVVGALNLFEYLFESYLARSFIFPV